MKLSRILPPLAAVILFASLLTLIYRPQYAINIHYLGRPDPFSYHEQRQKVLRVLDPQIPPGSVIFLGDSLTERLPVEQLGANIYNLGVSGDTIKDLSNRIDDYTSLKSARLIVLEIGTNNANNFREGDLSELAAKLPAVSVLWYAAPPVDKKIIKGTDIDKINQKAAELCAKINNCNFVNLTDQFSDSAGNLKYHIGDGVHFNVEANQIWLNDLKSRL